VEESGFTDSYQSVKRFVAQVAIDPARSGLAPGMSAGGRTPAGFRLRAPIDDAQGKTRRSWVLRMALSYSRNGYSEAVSRQDTETFLRCSENGLRRLKADRFDPQVNQSIRSWLTFVATTASISSRVVPGGLNTKL
jgi:hypothetical protein